MAKSKNKHKGKSQGKPKGATYADVLARKRAVQAGLEKFASDTALQIEADTRTQRAMWLMVCSIADAFGVGPERMKRDFFPALQANTDELNRMREEVDEEYAYDKLKQRAEQVTGIDITYMYEHEMKAAGLKLSEDGEYVPITRFDKIKEQVQSVSYEGMAELIEKYVKEETVNYCERRPECYKAIGSGTHEFKCRECLVRWLKEPAEGAN